MADNINVRTGGGSIFNRIPWTFLLIAYLVVGHVSNMDMQGIAGYVFIGLGMLVLFLEFFKSGDISTGAFLSDVISAVVAVALSTGLLTYLYYELDQQPSFYHWLGYAIIIGDAIMSPFNGFRTALRNFGVGG